MLPLLSLLWSFDVDSGTFRESFTLWPLHGWTVLSLFKLEGVISGKYIMSDGGVRAIGELRQLRIKSRSYIIRVPPGVVLNKVPPGVVLYSNINEK